MRKNLWTGIAVAALLVAGQAANATTLPFDPNTNPHLALALPEGSETAPEDVLELDVNGTFVNSVTGAYLMFDAGVNGALQVSDVITVDNGNGGHGRIIFASDPLNPLVPPPTGRSLGVEDPTNGLTALLDLPLINGMDLGVTLFSDGSTSTTSDTIAIDVPEPASLVLLGVGLVALGRARRRRV